MLRALVDAEPRFHEEGSLPVGYKKKSISWIIDLAADGTHSLLGPFRRGDVEQLAAPERPRTSNVKPYLVVDDGRYVFGLAEPERELEANSAHKGYMELLAAAVQSTTDNRLSLILEFLNKPVPADIRGAIPAKGQWIAFRVDGELLVNHPAISEFWATCLQEDRHPNDSDVQCSCCGEKRSFVRIMPGEVVIMGQKCQIASFQSDKTAFSSFSKMQMANSPLCFTCASRAIQALRHLIDDERHHVVVQRDRSKSTQKNSLKNQLAVFWLKVPTVVEVEDQVIDIEASLAALMDETLPRVSGVPTAHLGQLRALVNTPWTPRRRDIRIDDNAFYLAVLSANKARLVVREWLEVSIQQLRSSLRTYLDAVTVVDPGGRVYPASIQAMAEAAECDDPNLVRGLARTAFAGYPPPAVLRDAATRRMRVPAVRREPTQDMRSQDRIQQQRRLHALAAALKLGLTFGREDRASMTELDERHQHPAYLCGRLLALLEEIQRRSTAGKLNATVVDTYYGSASSTPASVFGVIVGQATKAHMPKIQREQRGYANLEDILRSIMVGIDNAGGFPLTLSMQDQAEFALGFYQQRVKLRPSQ